MKPDILQFSENISDMQDSLIKKNSIFLNIFMFLVFIWGISIFIYISYRDKIKNSKDNTLRKLLFIKRNT